MMLGFDVHVYDAVVREQPPFIQELSETDNKNIQTDLIIMDFA
jgi:hypothetical protein